MEVMVRSKKSGTVTQDRGAEVLTAGAGVEVTREEEAEAEVTIATTDEAGVAATREEEEATAATATTGGEVTAVSYQIEGEARDQVPDHVREVEQLVKWPFTFMRTLAVISGCCIHAEILPATAVWTHGSRRKMPYKPPSHVSPRFDLDNSTIFARDRLRS